MDFKVNALLISNSSHPTTVPLVSGKCGKQPHRTNLYLIDYGQPVVCVVTGSKTLEEFEYTKRVIRIRISKKNRQHNGQKEKCKQLSTKQTHKTKDRATRTPLKTGKNACYIYSNSELKQ